MKAGALVLLAVTAVAACGGGGGGPGRLRYHLDAKLLANVSPEERQELLAAQADWLEARKQQEQATSAVRRGERELADAKMTRESAASHERDAREGRGRLEKNKDFSKKNDASRNARMATLELRVAERKQALEEARLSHLRKVERYAAENAFAREARYEETKARLARRNNIRPAGFSYGNFAEQKDRRSRAAQHALHIADKEKARLSEREREWRIASEEVEQARGPAPEKVAPEKGGPETTATESQKW